MSKFLFISVKPEFSHKIISKEKTIELRKNRPNVKKGDHVLIYSTVPDKSILGFAKIKRIIELTPQEMWNLYSDKLGIDKERFDEYYSGISKSIGIEVSNVCKLHTQINLDMIKSYFPKFSPPQTYKYISNITALRTYKKLTLRFTSL
ncbi:ASCH domain-containing protein [Labilibaculum euxinus]